MAGKKSLLVWKSRSAHSPFCLKLFSLSREHKQIKEEAELQKWRGRCLWVNGGIPPKGNGLSPYRIARGGRCVDTHCTYFSTNGPLLKCVQTSFLNGHGRLSCWHPNVKLEQAIRDVTSPLLYLYTKGFKSLFAERRWKFRAGGDPQKIQKD